jgi:hypothetical protein
VGLQRSIGVGCALTRETIGKKTLRQSTTSSTCMGSRNPQPIFMNFGPLGGLASIITYKKFWFDRLNGFLFCEVLKMAISYAN